MLSVHCKHANAWLEFLEILMDAACFQPVKHHRCRIPNTTVYAAGGQQTPNKGTLGLPSCAGSTAVQHKNNQGGAFLGLVQQQSCRLRKFPATLGMATNHDCSVALFLSTVSKLLIL